jgi:hypothetical protein
MWPLTGPPVSIIVAGPPLEDIFQSKLCKGIPRFRHVVATDFKVHDWIGHVVQSFASVVDNRRAHDSTGPLAAMRESSSSN